MSNASPRHAPRPGVHDGDGAEHPEPADLVRHGEGGERARERRDRIEPRASMSNAASILVCDDDEVFRTRLGRAFAARGLDVRLAASFDEAVAHARAESPELAVVDLRMVGPGGLELLRELRAIDPATRVVVLTGWGSIANAVEAMRLGATHYLSKPADADEILAAFDGVTDPTAPRDANRNPKAPSLARAEWEHLQRVLSECGGNVSEAARALGLHRRSLQRKLQKRPPTR